MPKTMYRFFMFTFSLLVNSWSLTNFINCLKLSYTVSCSRYIDEKVKASYQALEKKFTTLGTAAPTDDELDLGTDENDDNQSTTLASVDEDEDNLKVTQEKPFKLYINKQMKNVYICTDKRKPENNLFTPKWIEILDQKWFAQTPFWSSILRGMSHKHNQCYCFFCHRKC